MSLEQFVKQGVADVLFLIIGAVGGLVVLPLVVVFHVLKVVLTWSFLFVADFAPLVFAAAALWLAGAAGVEGVAFYMALLFLLLVAFTIQVLFVAYVWDQRDYRGVGGSGLREVRGAVPHSFLSLENGIENLLGWVEENSYLYALEEKRDIRRRDAFLDEERKARQWAAEQNEKNKCKA